MKRTKIEIIPMIDTMFFLLVFFMLSSLAMSHLYGLNLTLPKSSTAPQQDKTNLTITIDHTQQVFVNSYRVAVTNIPGALQKAAGTSDISTDSVIINSDMGVPYGLVVECMDQARQAGAQHFAIATEAPAGK